MTPRKKLWLMQFKRKIMIMMKQNVLKQLAVLATVTAILLLATGCMSMGKLVKELSKDPAAFKLQVTTIYGTLNMSRAGANTNSIKITSEGEIINNPPPNR